MIYETREAYKLEQKRAKTAYKLRGKIIWHGSQGTRRIRQEDRIRGKAAIKLAKRLSHTRNYYAKVRALAKQV